MENSVDYSLHCTRAPGHTKAHNHTHDEGKQNHQYRMNFNYNNKIIIIFWITFFSFAIANLEYLMIMMRRNAPIACVVVSFALEFTYIFSRVSDKVAHSVPTGSNLADKGRQEKCSHTICIMNILSCDEIEMKTRLGTNQSSPSHFFLFFNTSEFSLT